MTKNIMKDFCSICNTYTVFKRVQNYKSYEKMYQLKNIENDKEKSLPNVP